MWLISVVSRHRALMNVFDKAPILDKEAFVTVILEEDHLFWYGFVLRGEQATMPPVFGG